MKKTTKTSAIVAILALMLTVSCAPQNGFVGSAHDHTGTNGATNGNGKAPSGSAHTFRY